MKTLNAFEFTAAAAKTQHDWDTILDGKIRQLEEGKDYKCKASTLSMMARKAAKKRGMGVRVNKVEGGLVIQAYAAEAAEATESRSRTADSSESNGEAGSSEATQPKKGKGKK